MPLGNSQHQILASILAHSPGLEWWPTPTSVLIVLYNKVIFARWRRWSHDDCRQWESNTDPLLENPLMFKSLHGCAPLYLSDACKSAPQASRRLRSSGAITCVIPWSITHLGDRSFDVAKPRLWNKLPASLRSSDSLCQFRRQLETFLFVKY